VTYTVSILFQHLRGQSWASEARVSTGAEENEVFGFLGLGEHSMSRSGGTNLASRSKQDSQGGKGEGRKRFIYSISIPWQDSRERSWPPGATVRGRGGGGKVFPYSFSFLLRGNVFSVYVPKQKHENINTLLLYRVYLSENRDTLVSSYMPNDVIIIRLRLD
jgi:hypothetical protein